MATTDARNIGDTTPDATGQPWRWLALCVVVAAAFMTTLDDFIVFVAEPGIQRGLHMSTAELQWVVAGYVLAYGVAVVTGGRLGDIYGRKRIFMLGLWGFTLASLLCGLAPSTPFLLAARVLEGLMAAMMFPQVFSLIKVMFRPAEQGLAIGIVGAVIGAAAIGGQLLGGLLLGAAIAGLTWQPIFFVNVPIGLAAALAAPFLLSESRSETATRVDGPGVLLVSLSLLLFTYPLVEGRETGWPRPLWACFAACLPATWLFIRYERYRTARVGSPLLELALFRNHLFVRSLLVLLLETALGSGLFFILALYLQIGHHFTPFNAGIVFTPMAITYVLGSLLSNAFVRRLGTRVLHIGIAIASLGTLVTLAAVVSSGETISLLTLLPLAIMGFGNALVATPLPGFIIAIVKNDALGAAAGAISTAQQLGPALGVAVIGVIFFGVLGPRTSGSAYSSAFATSLLCYTLAICVVQMVLVLGLPRTLEPTLKDHSL